MFIVSLHSWIKPVKTDTWHMERQIDKSPLCCPVLHMLTSSLAARGVRQADVNKTNHSQGSIYFCCTAQSSHCRSSQSAFWDHSIGKQETAQQKKGHEKKGEGCDKREARWRHPDCLITPPVLTGLQHATKFDHVKYDPQGWIMEFWTQHSNFTCLFR